MALCELSSLMPVLDPDLARARSLRALRDALERHDVAALRALFADNIVCHEIAHGGPVRSTHDCAAALSALLAPVNADGVTLPLSVASELVAGPYATFILEWRTPASGGRAPAGGHVALIVYLSDAGKLREVWAIELLSGSHGGEQ